MANTFKDSLIDYASKINNVTVFQEFACLKRIPLVLMGVIPNVATKYNLEDMSELQREQYASLIKAVHFHTRRLMQTGKTLKAIRRRVLSILLKAQSGVAEVEVKL